MGEEEVGGQEEGGRRGWGSGVVGRRARLVVSERTVTHFLSLNRFFEAVVITQTEFGIGLILSLSRLRLRARMQAPTQSVKGNLGIEIPKWRVLPRFSEVRQRSLTWNLNLCTRSGSTCSGLSTGDVSMGVGLVHARNGSDTAFLSSAKSRSIKAQASGGDIEDLTPINPQEKSSWTVLPFVGVACLGAILFGYHLGVVNGALEYLAKDLGIAENTVLQGITLLAGATVGSFTGGTLADKFGRTRTFQLDAIPLIIGAFLTATAQSVQTMIIGRLLAGIGIGISSAIVPLYISEISPTEIRGALGSINQLFICIGILAALVAGLPLAGNPQCDKGIEFLFGVGTATFVGIFGKKKNTYRIGANSHDFLALLGFCCCPLFVHTSYCAPCTCAPYAPELVSTLNHRWRTMFGIAAVPSILLALGMAFSPESPRWLFQQGKIPEAEKAIRIIYGKERVVEIMYELRNASQGSTEPEAGWFDLFSSRYWK
ncbi:hypothetical protein V6N11_061745, partial [Hibiscus sabdariffa]